MSVAVGYRAEYADSGLRQITRHLEAWDTVARSAVLLEPGIVISGCRIDRNGEGGEPYVMEFRYSGRQYSCPLFRFQPRTESLHPAGCGEISAREAAAV